MNKNKFLKNQLTTILLCFLFIFPLYHAGYSQSYSVNTFGTIPDSSAMLDIISNNKGLLIPRVSLISTVDSATIAHPAVSLQVYNTNTSMTGGGKGFWYWDGTKWVRQIAELGADSIVVGSNTSSHLFNLQVTGTAGVTTSLTVPLIVGGPNSTDSLVYRTTNGNGTSGADHIFQVGNNGGTEAMRILNNGNIGIGLSPTHKMDILNTIGTTNAINSNSIITTSTTGITGIASFLDITPNADISQFYAGNFGLMYRGTQKITNATQGAIGLRVTALNLASIGTADTLTNLSAINLNTQNTGITTNMQHVHIRAATNTGGGTVDNYYGIRIENQTVGSNLCAAFHSNISAGSNKYNLFMNGTAQNYLAGNTGIGIASPTACLNLKSGTAAASTAPLKFTSGTLLTSPEAGAIEFLTDAYYATITTGTARKTFAFLESPVFTGTPSLPTGTSGTTQSLNDSTTKIATTAFVDRAISGVSGGSGWGLSGNSGTTDGTNFIGTTDNKPFTIKVNNQKAGRLDNSMTIAFWGYQAGNANTTGNDNTFIGYQAGKTNTTGESNTVTGSQALYSTTTGIRNTANGAYALYSNTTGFSNVAVGMSTLFSNTTGYYNIAVGLEALWSNTTGNSNIAIGQGSLVFNSTGTDNSVLGTNALRDNTGSYNTAIGSYSLRYISTGNNNTGIGYASLYTNSTGSNNTALGYGADVSANNYSNATAVGNGAIVLGSNRVQLGNTSATNGVYAYGPYTNLSDGRFKINIKDEVKGLEFIKKLHPVTYQLDVNKLHEFSTKNMKDSVKTKYKNPLEIERSKNIIHNGFIAQEVEQAAQETGYTFSGVHKPDDENDTYGLAYGEFVVPLVKAVQEQQKIIELQSSRIEKLEIEIQQIRNKTK